MTRAKRLAQLPRLAVKGKKGEGVCEGPRDSSVSRSLLENSLYPSPLRARVKEGPRGYFFPSAYFFSPPSFRLRASRGTRRESEPSEMKKKGEKKGKGRVWRGVSGKNEKCRWVSFQEDGSRCRVDGDFSWTRRRLEGSRCTGTMTVETWGSGKNK